MGPRCSSTETQVCHRSYIIAARKECVSGHLQHRDADKLMHMETVRYTHICHFCIDIISRVTFGKNKYE
jgi:hypothetical protein